MKSGKMKRLLDFRTKCPTFVHIERASVFFHRTCPPPFLTNAHHHGSSFTLCLAAPVLSPRADAHGRRSPARNHRHGTAQPRCRPRFLQCQNQNRRTTLGGQRRNPRSFVGLVSTRPRNRRKLQQCRAACGAHGRLPRRNGEWTYLAPVGNGGTRKANRAVRSLEHGAALPRVPRNDRKYRALCTKILALCTHRRAPRTKNGTHLPLAP